MPFIRCQPARNIVYLKTHKCASSTLYNILQRYILKHRLNMVMSRNYDIYMGHPAYFRPSFVIDMRDYNLSNNIITDHMRFSKPEVARVMPEDSLYVTTLRKPEEAFESLFSVCDFKSRLGKDLEDFVSDESLITSVKQHRLYSNRFGFNQMSFDLGLGESDWDNATAVDEFVKFVGETFHLVMIADRLDESLILFKHLTCWTTEDIVAFKVNARMDAYKVPMTQHVRERLKRLNHVDLKLYEHFSAVLDEKVRIFGEHKMAQEVRELRTLREKYHDLCVEAEVGMRNITKKGGHYKALGFKLKDHSETCSHMAMTGMQLRELIRDRQKALIRGTVRTQVAMLT
ncbi:galactosylceramide sulfotransferase-like [Ornithodoros turicata]|uniref:galactosylceramide sulfotransferase-like n=1 Tax=Ornithodoros turicata TaxID=34597 RepID=UPI00313A2160